MTKFRMGMLAIAATAGLATTGCTTNERTLGGALIGGTGGAVVGKAVGGSTGLAVGAIAGGATGALVGRNWNRR